MNKKNMRELAKVLEGLHHDGDQWRKEPNGFCLNYLKYDCGTPACIAGWSAALALRTSRIPNDVHVERTAADWLELDYEWVRHKLFYPDMCLPSDVMYEDVTPQWAAGVVRAVAEATDPTSLDMWNVWSSTRPSN